MALARKNLATEYPREPMTHEGAVTDMARPREHSLTGELRRGWKTGDRS